jgi:hypothetical protein
MATIKKSAKKYATGGTVTTETTKKPTDRFKKTPLDRKLEKSNKGQAYGVVVSKEDEKKNPKDFEYLKKKSGGTIKKAQGGTSFAKLAPPYDKATFADKIAGAKKNAGKAKSGTKIKKAGTHKMPGGSMMKNSMMKSGGKMKTCKGGC